MFDIGAIEILVIVIVAILVIGPKDMPGALRMAGRWIGKMRRVSSHFRSGLDAMIREAELEDMEKKWQEQNAQIMKQHPDAGPEMTELGKSPPGPEELVPDPMRDDPPPAPPADSNDAPQLPLDDRKTG